MGRNHKRSLRRQRRASIKRRVVERRRRRAEEEETRDPRTRWRRLTASRGAPPVSLVCTGVVLRVDLDSEAPLFEATAAWWPSEGSA